MKRAPHLRRCRTVYEDPFLTLVADDCVTESGRELKYAHFLLPEWVNIVPVLGDGSLLMIRQYRHGNGQMMLEIPGGVVEEGESPEDAARRELLEETGATGGELIHLSTQWTNPALQNNALHSYLAVPVEFPAGFESEEGVVEVVPASVWRSPGFLDENAHLYTTLGVLLALREMELTVNS